MQRTVSKLSTAVFLYAALPVILHAQVPACTGPMPDHVYGTYGPDDINDAVMVGDGNIIACGSFSGTGGNVDATRYGSREGIVLKMDPSGTLLWSRAVGGPEYDELRTILPFGDGCIVAGTRASQGWYLRLDGAGTVVWESAPDATLPAVFDMVAAGPASALLSTGRIIDMNDGHTISSFTMPRAFTDVYQQMAASADGGYLLALTLGSSETGGIWTGHPPAGMFPDIGLVKLDAAGTVQWVHRINYSRSDMVKDVVAVADGYLILSYAFAGPPGGDRLSPMAGANDFWVIRTDLAGTILWERTFGSSTDDFVEGAIPMADGGFVVYGYTGYDNDHDVTEPTRGSDDGWMVRISSTGNKMWDKRWGGNNIDRFISGVALTDGFLMLGKTSSDLGYDRIDPGLGISSTNIWVEPVVPGSATTWYTDTDSDGFGDPASAVTTCAPSPGSVSNGNDCDPVNANPYDQYLGARCNDGNFFTFPDRLVAGCSCYGSIPDFLFDHFNFHLLPDAFAIHLSMAVFISGNAQPIMTFGPWPNAQPGVPIDEGFDLPPGAYSMRVFDAQADGILNGGFSLSVNGKPIVQADGAFQQASEAPLGFEVPIGEVSLTVGTCGRLDLLPSSTIISGEDPAVSARYNPADANTGYQFWIFNPHGGYSRRIFKSHKNPGKGQSAGPTACAHLKLSSLQTNPVPQQLLLNVRVRSCIDGLYGAFGPACTMKIDPYAQVCPTTKLVDNQSNPNFSCYVLRNFGGSEKVVAYSVAGANKYQFEFSNADEGYTRTITSPNNTRLLSWSTVQPLCGTFTYLVRVRVSLNGGQTWCPWGATCPVAITNNSNACTPPGAAASAGSQRTLLASPTNDQLSIFPNPTSDHRFTLELEGVGDAPLDFTVSDIGGRVVHRDRSMPSLGRLSTTVQLPGSLSQGTYLVQLSNGTSSWHGRLVLD